jgi:hypothetical protein
MKIKHMLSVCFTALILATTGYGQTTKPARDYLSVPGPLRFNKISYNLVWTSHPAAYFYKQEYIAAGDNVEKFKTLILLDFVTGRSAIKDVVDSKIAELKKLKETNPVVNYEIFENKGEYMLDFLLSENTPDGKVISIVERNVYRYKTVVDKSGEKGVLLFGVSERSYGDDIDKFFASLKLHKKDLLNAVAAFEIPVITIVK